MIEPAAAVSFEDWGRSVDPTAVEIRDLGDGRAAYLAPLLFHWTIKLVTIGDMFGYDDRWCYQTEILGRRALATWDFPREKEPTGWHRHPSTGRRRTDGNPAAEYVAW